MKNEVDLTVCKPARKVGSPKLKRELRRLLIVIAVAMLTAAYLPGCAKPAEPVYMTVYNDVLVPVKCEVDMPVRPLPADNPVVCMLDILQYAQELEITLKICRGE